MFTNRKGINTYCKTNIILILELLPVELNYL